MTTKNPEGVVLAIYPAIAFLGIRNIVHIDGRGAPIADPHAPDYSPDSFAIHDDGSVEILDDQGTGASARVISTPDDPGHRPAAP